MSAKHTAEITALWNVEYPIKLKDRYALLLSDVTQCLHFYVLNDQDEIIAWSVLFEKENDLRFSIIVSGHNQQKGLGSTLLAEMKKEGKAFSGWVIDHNLDLKSDGTLYQSPLKFYLKNGFSLDESCRLNNEMIKAVLVRYQPMN